LRDLSSYIYIYFCDMSSDKLCMRFSVRQRKRAAPSQMAVNVTWSATGQFTVEKGRQSTPCGDARERLHTDPLREASRAAHHARASASTSPCDGDSQRERDLLVAEPVDFPQDDSGALLETGGLQRVPHPTRRFLPAQREFGVAPGVRQHVVAVLLEVRVGGDTLIRLEPAPPPPLPVPGKVDRDAIDPRSKRRLAAEPVNRAEDLKGRRPARGRRASS